MEKAVQSNLKARLYSFGARGQALVMEEDAHKGQGEGIRLDSIKFG